MSEERISLVLACLNRMDDKLDRLLERMGELTMRVGSLEMHISHIHDDVAAQSVRFDQLSSQIEKELRDV